RTSRIGRGAARRGPRLRSAEASILRYMTARSRVHQRTGVLEVFCHDRFGRPIGECADWAGGVVRRLLREGRGAHDEEIVGVPGLQVTIDDARLWVMPHD